MASYAVKDIFLTLQGEGARAGAKSLFVRFAGCNLWSGSPAHRDSGSGPCAKWCDTDFFKGEAIELDALRARMATAWGDAAGQRWCVITGGEPGLQIDDALVDALHADRWLIAVETNGTLASAALRRCDHICVSPKRGTAWTSLGAAHEVKVILPGEADGTGWTDAELADIEARAGDAQLFVQPQDPIVSTFVEQSHLKRTVDVAAGDAALLAARYDANVRRCIDFVMRHPRWRLSAQLHKFVGIA